MKKAGKVKTLTAVLALSFMFCASAFAQTGGSVMEEQKGMMSESMMQMCMPMMRQMMGQGMMPDMMLMMADMLMMQEKMMAGMTSEEKKKMAEKMAQMREKMADMQTGMMGMMGRPSNDRLKCAEEWLKKAIDLHEVHIKDPKTATESSQMEMMEQMKNAYQCITGGAKESPSEGKETGKDPHGH